MIDRFKIGQIDALDMKIDENNQNTIRMIYKKFYVLLTVENPVLCQKWFNSLQYVKENNEKYVYNRQRNLSRYRKLKVFELITGKSVFKSYDVLLQNYEMKQMQLIWIKGHVYMH